MTELPEAELSLVQSPAPRAAWSKVYCSDPASMPSHSLVWRDTLLATNRYEDVSRYYRFADGTEAIVPIYAGRHRIRPLTPRWSPPSGWGFGGAISTAPLSSSHRALILRDIAKLKSLIVHIRPNPVDARFWQDAAAQDWTRYEKRVHMISLEGGFDTVWAKRFKPRTRTTINKALKSDLVISRGNDPELIRAFYSLLEKSFLRWARQDGRPEKLALWGGRRRDPIDRFHRLASGLGPMFEILLAEHNDEPAAAILLLQDRNAHYTRGAMDDEVAGKTGAAYVLHYHAIKSACEAGCSYYNMGETGNHPSLAQFKTRFGAEDVGHIELRKERFPFSRMEQQARQLLSTVTRGRFS